MKKVKFFNFSKKIKDLEKFIAKIYQNKLLNCLFTVHSSARGAAIPLLIFWQHTQPAPSNNLPVPQVLKQVVNLSCNHLYLYFYYNLIKRNSPVPQALIFCIRSCLINERNMSHFFIFWKYYPIPYNVTPNVSSVPSILHFIHL